MLPLTAPRLPAVVLSNTVSLPLTMSLLLLSFSCTVIVLVLLPSAAMLVGLALIVLAITLVVNLLLENLLEPRLLGGSLNLHPLLILLATQMLLNGVAEFVATLRTA